MLSALLRLAAIASPQGCVALRSSKANALGQDGNLLYKQVVDFLELQHITTTLHSPDHCHSASITSTFESVSA
jgi:hypothetical protein